MYYMQVAICSHAGGKKFTCWFNVCAHALQVNGPSVYRSYLAAAQRVGLSDAAAGYWELHIKEDERHGRQMVEDVAVPLIEQ